MPVLREQRKVINWLADNEVDKGVEPHQSTSIAIEEPESLDSCFKEKLFRFPDYQSGYAWGREQLDVFWKDLRNLPDGRSHYTGVLTLKEIPATKVRRDDKRFWLVDGHSYKLYRIVDGQQQLTTPIGGKKIDITLKKSYKFNWVQKSWKLKDISCF